MRMLMAGVAVTVAMLASGCATLQNYPSFGQAAGGRIVTYDRRGAQNLYPPSEARPVVPQSDYSRIR